MPNIDVTTALQEFAGNPQQAGGIAEFLGFNAITNPVDQLADPAAAALAAFFGSQPDYFGVKELYRAGRQEAAPAAVGLWIAVMADWGRRSGDRDRARRRISRALVEHVPERRNLAILTPPAGDRSREIELLFPRIPTARNGVLRQNGHQYPRLNQPGQPDPIPPGFAAGPANQARGNAGGSVGPVAGTVQRRAGG